MTTTRDRRTPTDALDTRDGIRIDLVLPEVVHEMPAEEAVVAIDDLAVTTATDTTTTSIAISAEAAIVEPAHDAVPVRDPAPLPDPDPAPRTRRHRWRRALDAARGSTPDVLLEPAAPAGAAAPVTRRDRPAPEGVWRRLVWRGTFRLANPGDAPRARRRKERDARIAVPFDQARFVAVLSRKGGVGATTVTTLLGMALAAVRPENAVLAVDAHPDRGTLADRVPGGPEAGVRDVAVHARSIRTAADLTPRVARDVTRLDVLGSDRQAGSREFTPGDYHLVAEAVAPHYDLVVTDAGAGLSTPTVRAVLQRADALVLVTGGALDEVRLASDALTWLTRNGHAELARDALLVVDTATSGTDLDRLDEVDAHFADRVSGIVHIPFDEELFGGGPVRYTELRDYTRESARDLALAVVEGVAARESARAEAEGMA